MVVQIKAVMGIQLIVQVGAHDGERTLVVAHGWFFAHNLVALAHDVSSVPIVLPIGSVHGQGMVPGVGEGGILLHVLQDEVVLLIAGRDVPGIGIPFCHSVYFVLNRPRLQFLVCF